MQLFAEVQAYVSQLLGLIHVAMELSLEDPRGLSENSLRNLDSPAILGLIANGSLNVAQAIALSLESRSNLESPAIRGLITDNTLTLAQAIDLRYQSRWNLESPSIRGLIADGSVILKVLLLSNNGIHNRSFPNFIPII